MWILAFTITFLIEGYSVEYKQTFPDENGCLASAFSWMVYDLDDETIKLEDWTICEQEISE